MLHSVLNILKIGFNSIFPLKLVLVIALSTVSFDSIVIAQNADGEEIFWDEEENDDEEYDGEEYDDEEYDDENFEAVILSAEEVSAALADEAASMGWSIDISGSSPRFVNESLMKWNSGFDLRASIEAPILIALIGMKFRLGGEIGTYGFKDSMPPQSAEIKGLSIMGLTSFPIGPGKIKVGMGIIGKSVGYMFEPSYGLQVGAINIRVGVRYASLLSVGADVVENFSETAKLNWMDGLVAVGVKI